MVTCKVIVVQMSKSLMWGKGQIVHCVHTQGNTSKIQRFYRKKVKPQEEENIVNSNVGIILVSYVKTK